MLLRVSRPEATTGRVGGFHLDPLRVPRSQQEPPTAREPQHLVAASKQAASRLAGNMMTALAVSQWLRWDPTRLSSSPATPTLEQAIRRAVRCKGTLLGQERRTSGDPAFGREKSGGSPRRVTRSQATWVRRCSPLVPSPSLLSRRILRPPCKSVPWWPRCLSLLLLLVSGSSEKHHQPGSNRNSRVPWRPSPNEGIQGFAQRRDPEIATKPPCPRMTLL